MHVFISYSHRNREYLEEFIPHLDAYRREAPSLGYWYDQQMAAGQEIDSTILEAVNRSRIALAFISSEYIQSNYCFEIELNVIRQRREAGLMSLIPIILNHCNWQRVWLGELLAIPSDGSVITDARNRAEHYQSVISRLRSSLNGQIQDSRHPVIKEAIRPEAPEETRGFKQVAQAEYFLITLRDKLVKIADSQNSDDYSMNWNLSEFGSEHVEASHYVYGRLRERLSARIVVGPSTSVVVNSLNAPKIEVSFRTPQTVMIETLRAAEPVILSFPSVKHAVQYIIDSLN